MKPSYWAGFYSPMGQSYLICWTDSQLTYNVYRLTLLGLTVFNVERGPIAGYIVRYRK